MKETTSAEETKVVKNQAKKVQLSVENIVELATDKALLEKWTKLVEHPDIKAHEALKLARIQ